MMENTEKKYYERSYKLALENTKYNSEGKAVITLDDEREQKNITTSNNTLLLIGEYNNKRNEVYTITTGNLIGEETTGPYRKTRTSFTVVWE